MPISEESFIARYHASYERGGRDECWNWTKGRIHGRHGQFHSKEGNVVASRFGWELYNGKIPKGYCVCHKCDNPACQNPTHLFLGTMKDNMDDMHRKGRQRHPKGEEIPWARLKAKDVLEIRKLLAQGVFQKDIGKKFGISQKAVSRIKLRKVWKHILD